ncbi:MAG: hypothetical protein AAGP08_04820 [Pseudomonadota bacterium]
MDLIWTKGAPEIRVSGGLRARPKLEASFRDPTGTDIGPNSRPGGLTVSGRRLRGPKDEKAWIEARARAAKGHPVAKVTAKADSHYTDSTQEFDDLRIRMLDVSTNRDQIGVALKVEKQTKRTPYEIEGMQVHAALEDMRVFALPQIQWEPVRTLESDQKIMEMGYFPTPLAAGDDGGPTQIASDAATLVPAIPDVTVDEMVSAFDEGAPLRMATTLPFGIQAMMKLEPSATTDREADQIERVAPVFDAHDPLTGGLQMAVTSGASRQPGPIADPGFGGLAYQRANGLDLNSGAPLNLSVLGETKAPDGSVEALFNEEFVFSRPKVPVTRLDISGYGGSTFSDWRNPTAAFAEAAKVQFQVMVGRTALEVIKFVSILYPWAIRVTRSVTIERGAGAGILRRDSGWQAASDGLFYVPDGTNPAAGAQYEVHPGLIQGLFEVDRIRPADRDRIDLPGGGAVLPMLFDAEIALGTKTDMTRAPITGVLGYLHLEPVGGPISVADMTALIETMGPAGGALDTRIEIANSRFGMRALRAEMALAHDGPDTALVGAVRGAPEFSSSGSWSVVTFPGPTNFDAPPEAAPVKDGTPVIRRGMVGPPTNGRVEVSNPDPRFRFADAEDLFRPLDPALDYAFLQSTSTHAFAYRRPYLEPSPGINVNPSDIHAGLPTLLADVFTRTTGSALFPPEDMAITLPPSTKLMVDPVHGVPVLTNPVSMQVTRPPVVLTDTAVGGTDLDYAGTTLSLAINHDSWSMMMPGIELYNTVMGIPRVSGGRFDVVGGSATQNRLDNGKALIGGIFQDALDVIPGLSNQYDLPTYPLGATNAKAKHKLKVAAKFTGSLGDELQAFLILRFEVGSEEVAVPADLLPPGKTKLTVATPFMGAGLGIGIRGETPGVGVVTVIGFTFNVGFQHNFSEPVPGGTKPVKAKSKLTFGTRWEAGAGWGGKIAAFKAFGYVIGIIIRELEETVGTGTTAVTLGVGVRGELNFKVTKAIKVQIYTELLGMIRIQGAKKFFVGQGEIGFNVKFGMIFSIKFAYVGTIKHELT